jgi:sulfonate transport system permease protein
MVKKMLTAFNSVKPLFSVIALVIVWALITDIFKIVEPLLLPGIFKVLSRLAQDLSWVIDLQVTLLRWMTGFMIGAFLGGLFGVLTGWSQKLMQWTIGVFELFRALPITAVFPLLLLLLGIGDESKIAMAAYPTFFITAINTAQAMRNASPQRRMMARSFGASNLQVFKLIALPEALPGYLTGLRVSLSLSLAVAVVAEMFIGTDRGLGQKIFDSYLMSDSVGLYAYLILIGLTGWLSTSAFTQFENRLLPWIGK